MAATEAKPTTNGHTNGVHQIGRPVPRVDALEKVTGRAKYTADLHLPGMLYGVFLRSPYAHARITSIDTSEAEQLPGVVAIITGETIAKDAAIVVEEEMHAARRVLSLFPKAGETVKYHGQKIAAVAAVTREIAQETC